MIDVANGATLPIVKNRGAGRGGRSHYFEGNGVRSLAVISFWLKELSMHRLLALIAASVVAMVASCATDPAHRLRMLSQACGNAGDQRPWKYLSAPPASADAMRQAAHPMDPHYQPPRGEYWFSLPTGEIKLCHHDPNLRASCGLSDWTEFRHRPDGGYDVDWDKSIIRVCGS